MKKNITINLCGRLFQIDDDAYEMLQHYVDSLRSHFTRQMGGDEIVNDIEERIAELFDELKTSGTEAITIDHVKDIITRIGKPEQLAGEEDNPEFSWQQEGHRGYEYVRSKMAGRKLYRNPNDKMLTGVLSGLATYTNTNVQLWRVGAILFTFFYGIGFLIYLVLAIVMPEAKTPEEMLLMQGKEVTPQNLADAMVDDQQSAKRPSSGWREVFSLLLKMVFGIFICISVIIAVVLGVAFLGVLMTTVFALVMPATSAVTLPFTLGGMGLAEVWEYHPAVLIGFTVSLLAVLFIPVYAIVHLVLSVAKKVSPMSMTQRIVWIVLWIVAFCCVIPLGSMVGTYHTQYTHERIAELPNATLETSDFTLTPVANRQA